MPLLLEIVTPEARVYSESVDSIVLPTSEGEIGILPGHIPLLCRIEAGEIIVQRRGESVALAVGDGFAQVDGDCVSVLAEQAIRVEQIDESAVEEAIQRAQERMAGARHLSKEESEQLEALMRFASAQLVAKKRRTR